MLKIIDNYLVTHSNILLVREAKSSVVGMMRLVLKTRTTTNRVWVLDSVVPLSVVMV